MRVASRFLLLLSAPLFLMSSMFAQTASKASGIKMTIQFTNGDRKSEEVIYLQSDRRRREYQNEYSGAHADGTTDVRYGPRIAAITRCDLGQRFELNLEDGQFEAWPDPQMTQLKEENDGRQLRNAQTGPPSPPILRVETTTFDTGERKNFFGHVARHVITTRKQSPLAGSNFDPFESVTDAWYIDLETQISCEPWAASGIRFPYARRPRGGSLRKYEFVEKGAPETGFEVECKETWRRDATQADGTKKEISFGNETNITQFVEAALDPALFEVPSNYRKVQSIDRNPPMTLTEAWNHTRVWLQNMTDRIVH
jgi:hypothetical protein